jgi:hypothetical protein
MLFLYLVTFFSCEKSNDDFLGVYTTIHNKKTIDTLFLYSNGLYERFLYRKNDSSLVFKNQSTWQFNDDRINFENFLIDKDEEYPNKEGENYFNDILVAASLPIKKEQEKIIIAIDHSLGHYYVKNK